MLRLLTPPSIRHALAIALCAAGLVRAPGAANARAAAAEAASRGAAVTLRAIGTDRATGIAGAVVVEAGALVHTALIYPDEEGRGRPRPGSAEGQVRRTLENIDLALKAAGTSLDRLVRLHVYVADASVTPAVDRVLAGRFARAAVHPALTLVQSAMPRSGVVVAMDAVAAVPSSSPGVRRIVSPSLPTRTLRASHAAILPDGPFVAVSGRAAPGDFEQAIPATLAQLRSDLEGAGLGLDDVVQIKSFVGDMAKAGRLQEIVAASFGGALAPPQVVTEWRQDAVAAEIELIAAAPPSQGPVTGSAVQYTEPILGRYSRVARVNTGRPVFLSGLYGQSADPVAQVAEMFDALRRLLTDSGSDVRHLVKSTYYVADPAVDERFNVVRPTIYDPAGPPAASKLGVRGTGRPGRASTFDMIAVTAGR